MKKRKKELKKQVLRKLLYKSLISIILFILFLILNKGIDNFDIFIYENVYNRNISFAKYNYLYETYFGSLFPTNNRKDIMVFNESIIYQKKEKYDDGVLLTVENNYLVPSIDDGIVVFIGKKDNYGNTIIIENKDGLDIWYSNINFLNINMYDYVNKGDFIGEAVDNKLLLIFKKDGKNEDYKKYI